MNMATMAAATRPAAGLMMLAGDLELAVGHDAVWMVKAVAPCWPLAVVKIEAARVKVAKQPDMATVTCVAVYDPPTPGDTALQEPLLQAWKIPKVPLVSEEPA